MPPLLAVTAFAGTLGVAATAHAGRLDACGDMDFQAEAQCELVAEGCEVECTPLAVEAACASSLQIDCAGECDFEAEVECTADCRADCEASCSYDPGSFDCNAGCRADCDASCFAACEPGDSGCEASCEANCAAECSASCDVVPPEADCVAQCEACCGGSCRAEVNLDCQLDCQADFFAECAVDVQGGCEADCSEAGAALFCDGNYVSAVDSIDACVDALQGLLDGEVEGSAELSCENGECNFASEGFLSCAVDDSPRRSPIALGFVAFLALALYGRRRCAV